MTNTEKALELVQKCLDDWPYAATRVVDIMTRLEKVKELLKEQEPVEPKKVKGYNPPMYTLYEYDCKNCKSPMMNKQPFCMGCGRRVLWE